MSDGIASEVGEVVFGTIDAAHVIRTRCGRFNVFVEQYGICTVHDLTSAEQAAVRAELDLATGYSALEVAVRHHAYS